MPILQLVTLVVRDYDPAIRFFVDVLGFELVENTPSQTNDGRPKRWVAVRPVGGQTSLLLARADGDHQVGIVGRQFAGRVGLFLRVDDFERAWEALDRDPVNQRWQAFMARLFEPVPDLVAGERFAMMKEVFYLE